MTDTHDEKVNSTVPKKLYRSKTNRMIGGVCGGFAEYINVEPVLIRIAWVAAVFFGGFGFLLYIVGLIIIPENPEVSVKPVKREVKNDAGLFWGSLLIIVGGALLLKHFGFFYYFNIWHLPWQTIWALLLIAIGIFMLYNFTPIGRKDKYGSDENGNAEANKQSRQIYRSKSNKMIGGVCGGIAEYFNLDPTLVRLAYVLISFASMGLSIVVYIVLMIVFPEMPDEGTLNHTVKGE
jgi:phage shock protein C